MDSSGIGLIMGRYKKVMFIGGRAAVTKVRLNFLSILLFLFIQICITIRSTDLNRLLFV